MQDERLIVAIFFITLILIGFAVSEPGERKQAILMSVGGGGTLYLILRLAPLLTNK